MNQVSKSLDEMTIEELKARGYDIFIEREQVIDAVNRLNRSNMEINQVDQKIREKISEQQGNVQQQ